MVSTKDITRIQIILQTDERLLVHIVLTSDGLIQRLGSGRLENDEIELLSGVADVIIFEKLLKYFPDEFFDSEGSYSDPNLRGQRLGLAVTIVAKELEHGFQIVYGSESEGPPDDIVAFVSAAIELTESWYQDHKN